MVACGTPQGTNRVQYRHSQKTIPHSDTHLRAVKQFEPEILLEGFDAATDQLTSGSSLERRSAGL
jgi:hypothetical protein